MIYSEENLCRTHITKDLLNLRSQVNYDTRTMNGNHDTCIADNKPMKLGLPEATYDTRYMTLA